MISEVHRQAACCDLAAEIARDHGHLRLRVNGLSMLPVLRPGDVLTIRQCPPEAIGSGEVILFKRNNGLTAHRVIRSTGGTLLTRGDAVPSNDPTVSCDDVLGRVESVERDGRPIDLHPSLRQKLVAAFLRHSESFTHLYLRLNGSMRRTKLFGVSFEY